MGEDAREVTAVAFAVDRKHPQYAGKLDVDAQLDFVTKGTGFRAPAPTTCSAPPGTCTTSASRTGCCRRWRGG
jgi:hypothetical protein